MMSHRIDSLMTTETRKSIYKAVLQASSKCCPNEVDAFIDKDRRSSENGKMTICRRAMQIEWVGLRSILAALILNSSLAKPFNQLKHGHMEQLAGLIAAFPKCGLAA